MDLGNILEYLNNDYSRYDDIKKNYIDDLSADSIFKIESEMIRDIYFLDEKKKDIDIIYLNYDTLKENINKTINMKKDFLINISNQKEEFNNTNIKEKIIYLSKEYEFYKEQTNTESLLNIINNLHNKIIMLKGELKNKKLDIEYQKIKDKYTNILIFINSEKFDYKKESIPKNINNDVKIIWYKKRIDELVEKQMIFNNYIFLLESYYNDVLNKRILDCSFYKEPV